MTPEMVMSIAYQGMRVTLLLAGPMLLAALFTGLIISLFQAATQINEMTLTFIPKILAVFAVLVLAGPWLIGLITDFTHRLFTNIPSMVM
ncbi:MULTISPECIES: flagellar biosynthesis protein FliQ [Halomonadaceae]|jgi:flagellar biosynthetic protein FliQ|uniref:Flagellar biosynthetic protein FliQ n=4 Tax=Halomonadaceae TaxID=28256 RepID=A0A7Z0SKL3_9GAMM|nr:MULTISPECIES: flagellar biosynthesis protein FliQ [Halomonas]NAO98885.1 flagellar biosynthesis protein FliQ [Halomonas sp. MG34]QGQ69020.1 flagellar biosynthesis protein FliQ [Halomonas sp. PA16-9]UEQ04370.1 flagellar biosynthesis protein FliQ [Halomonas profundus]KIN13148.1 flagellar biosynthetic protein FliQ [Halomonas sp. KHS3]MCD1587914.1 flagellar biosynthesis protein FliQ [Halomonas sp. IOP_14]|tara:strand:+ start:782 stop:1051 length:270 start_codon:yes stop_codon:yes gene_type:complete